MENLYKYYRDSEIRTKQNLVEFDDNYPSVLTEKTLSKLSDNWNIQKQIKLIQNNKLSIRDIVVNERCYHYCK